MTLLLTTSSFYSIFTQVPKTFNWTVALQVDLLKHLGNVATVLLYLVCLSLFCFFMSFQTDWKMMRSDICVEDCCCQTPGANKNISGLLQLMAK